MAGRRQGGMAAWMQLQQGGVMFHVEHICGAAGRGPQHDDIDQAVRGGREGEAGGSCLL